MENALPTLKYHVDLLKRQRKNVTFPFSVCSVNDGQLTSVFHCQVKAMEVGLEERGAVLCYLDFGGFYDSEGGKVSCWAITFVTGPELGQSYTVAVFFPGTVSKDADAGYRALSLLLDPAQDPSGENVSIFKRLFPDRHTLIPSGDTGNGFRSYDMWSYLAPVRNCHLLVDPSARLWIHLLGLMTSTAEEEH
jgi:hypothetical protein